MNITLLAFGSRGDVQPYLALAVGLQMAGHRVTLTVTPSNAAWVRAYGVNPYPVRFDMQAFLRQPEIQAILNGRNIFRQLRVMQGELRAGLRLMLSDFWEATASAEYVVATSIGAGGYEIATQRGLPLAYALLAPIVPPTRAFPSFVLPMRASLGGAYNRLTFPLMLRATWPVFGQPLNQWRAADLGLPPWRSVDQLLRAQRQLNSAWLYGFSPSVVPKPADWPDTHHVTGYWFLEPPAAWQPPDRLRQFLAAGPPPVYLGFGSVRVPDPEARTNVILRALELSGQRGVLLTGWGGLAQREDSPRVCYVDDVPHAWLFPRLAAGVHHGGAGTTAAGLRAGMPSIVTPFIGDQFAWCERVVKLGVGLAASAKKPSAEKLAQAIQTAVNDSGLRARASALGEKIRAEDGVGKAVRVIEQHAASLRRRSHEDRHL